jgi:hypothetical protein
VRFILHARSIAYRIGLIRRSIFVLIRLEVNIALIRGGQAGMGALSTALFAIRGKRERKSCRLSDRFSAGLANFASLKNVPAPSAKETEH